MLASLPPELLLLVFDELSVQDLCACRSVRVKLNSDFTLMVTDVW